MKNISNVSDRIFFGEWDAEGGRWQTEGRLNYSYSEKLSQVEECVKKQDYDGAKNALLKYYRERTEIPRASFDGGD